MSIVHLLEASKIVIKYLVSVLAFARRIVFERRFSMMRMALASGSIANILLNFSPFVVRYFLKAIVN